MSAGEELHQNSIVERLFKYFDHKGKEVCLVVRDKLTNEMALRSTMNARVAGKYILGEEGERDTMEDGWFTGRRDKFPMVPGKVRDVMADTSRLNRYAHSFPLLQPSSPPHLLLSLSSSPPHLLLLGTQLA